MRTIPYNLLFSIDAAHLVNHPKITLPATYVELNDYTNYHLYFSHAKVLRDRFLCNNLSCLGPGVLNGLSITALFIAIKWGSTIEDYDLNWLLEFFELDTVIPFSRAFKMELCFLQAIDYKVLVDFSLLKSIRSPRLWRHLSADDQDLNLGEFSLAAFKNRYQLREKDGLKLKYKRVVRRNSYAYPAQVYKSLRFISLLSRRRKSSQQTYCQIYKEMQLSKVLSFVHYLRLVAKTNETI